MSHVRVRDGRITGPRGTVLDGISLALESGGVTAIMGPSGSGKSALLRALAGEPPAPGWRFDGSWRVDGLALEHSVGGRRDVAWLPQASYRRHHPGESFSRPPAVTAWQDAFAPDVTTVLLDEPLRGHEGDRAAITAAVRARPTGSSVILITHDLAFAAAVSDVVCFVCAGRVREVCSTDTFFRAPPSALVERFVRQGNCWPVEATRPTLPSHFRWILPGRLAGMGKPGLLGDADEDLAALSDSGITLLVTLTEEPLPAEMLRAHGLASRHLAIRDMRVPALGAAASLSAHIERTMEGGGGVAVHCHAGLGRTGTILGCVLVWLGRSPEQAVAEIRAHQNGYIQNQGQLAFVTEFATTYAKKA